MSQPGCHHDRAAAAVSTQSAGRQQRAEASLQRAWAQARAQAQGQPQGAERCHRLPAPPHYATSTAHVEPTLETAQGNGGAAVAAYVPAVPAVGLFEALQDHHQHLC